MSAQALRLVQADPVPRSLGMSFPIKSSLIAAKAECAAPPPIRSVCASANAVSARYEKKHIRPRKVVRAAMDVGREMFSYLRIAPSFSSKSPRRVRFHIFSSILVLLHSVSINASSSPCVDVQRGKKRATRRSSRRRELRRDTFGNSIKQRFSLFGEICLHRRILLRFSCLAHMFAEYLRLPRVSSRLHPQYVARYIAYSELFQAAAPRDFGANSLQRNRHEDIVIHNYMLFCYFA